MYIEQAYQSHTAPLWQIMASLILAAITTLALVLLMHRLVFHEFIAPEDEALPPIPDITLDKPHTVDERPKEVAKPKPVDEPPTVAPIQPNTETTTDFGLPTVAVDAGVIDINLNASVSRFPVASVSASPRYPTRALNKEIEGWVDVRYDISRYGITENIQVLAAKPEGYFEKAAKNAIARWRYQPFVNDSGNPSPFFGITQRIVFQMEK